MRLHCHEHDDPEVSAEKVLPFGFEGGGVAGTGEHVIFLSHCARGFSLPTFRFIPEFLEIFNLHGESQVFYHTTWASG
jgi:hypothetical protein